jgi:hypothetical protein
MQTAIVLAGIDFVKSLLTKPKEHYFNLDKDTVKGLTVVLSAGFLYAGYAETEAGTAGSLAATALVAVIGLIDFLKKTKKGDTPQ